MGYDPIVNDDKVVLGEEVKIVFTSASSLLDIHIEECFAHNNKYKTADGDFLLNDEGNYVEDDGFNHIDLVEGDCFLTEKSDEKLEIIKPQKSEESCETDKTCTAFTFNQFAFTEKTDTSANPPLTFHMTCKVAIGQADQKDCSNKRRRRDNPSSFAGSQTFDILVERPQNGNIRNQDGIVTQSSETSSAEKNYCCLFTCYLFGLFGLDESRL